MKSLHVIFLTTFMMSNVLSTYPASAQESDDSSIIRSVACSVFGLLCAPDDTVTAEQLEEILRRTAIEEPTYGAFMTALRARSGDISQGGLQGSVDQGKSELASLMDIAEAAATEDLSDDTKAIIAGCLQTAQSLQDASVAVPGANPQAQVDAYPGSSACTDAVMEREREVTAELNQKDAEIEQLDRNILETEQKIRETDDPEERRRLQEEKAEQQAERKTKSEERARLERERLRLQQMRMLIGMVMIVAGLAAGGVPGMLMMMNGMNMLAPPSSGETGGDGDGRASHPTSSDLVSESNSTAASDQGGTKPEDVPANPNQDIKPVDAGDTSPDPEVVANLATDGSTIGAVPVSDNKFSNQGYYLEDHGDQYVLRHSEKTPFQVIIDPAKIQAEQPTITVPSPFYITKFVALSFDASQNVRIIVELQEQDDQFAIVQNSPLQDAPGLYLAQPEL